MLLKIIFILLINLYQIMAKSGHLDLNIPLLDTKNVKIVKNGNKEYQLSLNIPNSQRSESVLLDSVDNHLVVKGYVNTDYADGTFLRITYMADKNGYRSSFKIGQSSELSLGPRLSIIDLKSLAG